MGNSSYDTLQDCTSLLEDRHRLEKFLKSEGYLYLRGVFPVDVASEMLAQVVAGLKAQGARRIGPEPHRIELTEDFDVTALHPVVDYSVLETDRRIRSLIERVLDGPAYVWRSVFFRILGPGHELQRAASHQDGYYSPVNDDFLTFWTPLTPMEPDMGGLTLVPRSHLGGERPIVESETHRMGNTGGTKLRVIPPEHIQGRWAIAPDIQLGDVIVFHPHTVHEGRTNHSSSGYVRISLDFRAQPPASPRCAGALLAVPEFAEHMVLNDEGRPVLRSKSHA